MTHTQFLKWLGAPLAAIRQSWGSVRSSDGVVFLLVWQDRVQRMEDGQYVRITNWQEHGRDPANHGHMERLSHIELIRQGAACYLVMCTAKDRKANPRVLGDFDSGRVFTVGGLIEHGGEQWIKLGLPVSASEIRQIGSLPLIS